MLLTCQKTAMVGERDFIDEEAPNMKRAIGSQVPYGNCAETYPFAARFMGNSKQDNTSMAGVALKRDFLGAGEYPEYDEYDKGQIWSFLMGPCENCKILIARAGETESNFYAALDNRVAPRRSAKSLPESELLLAKN
ncbi:hypothetical protein FSARC_8677 [Fusarium sarcochroum]|uniref:Uncharacterized protein n=1 Tax=Fusarium sarcochroum TaxID=1208366 RepID=A0A8H4TSU1_9HYPO|nr:hypothetical protein FSARC_8677 [Fusarium sarcochroum]